MSPYANLSISLPEGGAAAAAAAAATPSQLSPVACKALLLPSLHQSTISYSL